MEENQNLLLDLETDPGIKVSGTYREYFIQLGKRLKYLHKLLQDFWMKRLALINKDRDNFQYNSGDLVYIISPLTSQLRKTSRKVSIKYVGPLVLPLVTYTRKSYQLECPHVDPHLSPPTAQWWFSMCIRLICIHIDHLEVLAGIEME